MDIKCLLAEKHIDKDTGCRYRLVRSESEYQRKHYHDYYEIFLMIQGEVLHLVNGNTQQLFEGALVFIRPNDLHIYQCIDNKNYIFANFTFTQETLEQLFTYLSDGFPAKQLLNAEFPPTVMLSESEKNQLFNQFEELNGVEFQDKNQLKFLMRTLLMQIFTKHFVNYHTTENHIPDWLEMTCEKMKKSQNFIEGASRMLEISGKSREHLSRCMKKYYNTTVNDYINDLKLNYLANRLKNSNIPILDLCYESGFQNISWCYTLFKEKYGITPKEFRKRK